MLRKALVVAFLLAQLGDLLTFLYAMRFVDASREIGPIGMLWSQFGDLGAFAYKFGFAALIGWICWSSPRPRLARIPLMLGTSVAVLGIVMNTRAVL